jgi:hypothetical protein
MKTLFFFCLLILVVLVVLAPTAIARDRVAKGEARWKALAAKYVESAESAVQADDWVSAILRFNAARELCVKNKAEEQADKIVVRMDQVFWCAIDTLCRAKETSTAIMYLRYRLKYDPDDVRTIAKLKELGGPVEALEPDKKALEKANKDISDAAEVDR